MNKKLQKGLAILEKLYEREHGICDDTTCGMGVAFNHGYTVHAIECWASTGAAGKRFDLVYSALRKQFSKQLDQLDRKQAKAFCKEVSSKECECGAYVWELEWNGGYCSNCGENALKNGKTNE